MTQFDYKRTSDETERQLGHPVVEDGFPYRRYFATHDARTSSQHMTMERLGLDSTAIYRADDPTWNVFRPPWGARHCRCSWAPMSVEQAARQGVSEAQVWLERAKAMAAQLGGSEYQYFERMAPAKPQFVAFPPFSRDTLCEPGTLYVWDYPLILDDLKSGEAYRVTRAIEDFRSLVPCKGSMRQLRDSLITASLSIDMADALMKIDPSALAAWPALSSVFISHVSQRCDSIVSWQSLAFDAMREVLNSGGAHEREQILSIWIASEDATVGTLVEMLACRHWDVRKAAVERLVQFGKEAASAIEELEGLASDRSKYVRTAAAEALNRILSVGET